MKKRGLGKGLDSLLGAAKQPSPNTVTQLPLEQLTAGKFQPRRHFSPSDMSALANSVGSHGVIQPLVVRPLKEGVFEIITGERRFRAAAMAGLKTVPVVVRDVSDDDARLFALIENLQRADLNPLEQAAGVAAVIAQLRLTHEQAGLKIGLSRAAVSNLLRLLELAAPVKKLLENGALDAGRARALLALPQKQQPAAAAEVVKKKLTTRATEALVKKILSPPAAAAKKTGDGDIRRLESELSEKLSLPVEIRHRRDGGGKMILAYGSLESLDNILKKLRR